MALPLNIKDFQSLRHLGGKKAISSVPQVCILPLSRAVVVVAVLGDIILPLLLISNGESAEYEVLKRHPLKLSGLCDSVFAANTNNFMWAVRKMWNLH